MVSYTAVSPLPGRSQAVCFLWRYPAGHPGLPLAATLPCGARTFLSSRRDRPASSEPARGVEPRSPPYHGGVLPLPLGRRVLIDVVDSGVLPDAVFTSESSRVPVSSAVPLSQLPSLLFRYLRQARDVTAQNSIDLNPTTLPHQRIEVFHRSYGFSSSNVYNEHRLPTVLRMPLRLLQANTSGTQQLSGSFDHIPVSHRQTQRRPVRRRRRTTHKRSFALQQTRQPVPLKFVHMVSIRSPVVLSGTVPGARSFQLSYGGVSTYYVSRQAQVLTQNLARFRTSLTVWDVRGWALRART